MPNRVTGLLVAHSEIHQVEVTLRADTAANAVEREVGSIQRELGVLIRDHSNGWEAHQLVQPFLQGLPTRIAMRLWYILEKIAVWSARQAGGIMRKSLPTDYLRAAAARRLGHERPRWGEALGANFGGGNSSDDYNRDHHFLEDTSTAPTGIIQLALRALGIEPTDYADPFREPARNEMSDEQQRDVFSRLLFPPPPQEWVQRVLGLTLQGQTWYQALNGSLRAAEFGPDHVAQVVANGYASGKTQAEIIDQTKPLLDGVKWRAARVARTYGLAVAGQAQQQMHEQLGDLEIGKMVRATLDERTRPKHRLRNGHVFYKHPKEGQSGYDAMPNPPQESDGSLAWNCRCFPGARSRPALVGER